MRKKSVRQTELQHREVLARVDFNVPLQTENSTPFVSDDTRIVATLPTLQLLLDAQTKIVLCSHLGRPKGTPNPQYSLRPVADTLAKLLNRPVQFAEDCIGPEAQEKRAQLKPGEILLLENVRFHPEEEKNEADFAKKLAGAAEVFVNDAFGSAHRAHASTEGVTHFIKESVTGLLMERELQYLTHELTHPTRPYLVILGGAKVSDKIQVIDRLLDQVDTILIGGAMAYTFALAQGRSVGASLSEPDQLDTARAALNKAKELNVQFLLPEDQLTATSVDFSGRSIENPLVIPSSEGIPDDREGVDIGPATVARYAEEIAKANTILWNGPMGIFEIEECSKGTFAIAHAVANNQNATTIIGGGDSVKAIKQSGVAEQISFISTGGGASLELLEGKSLPGVEALTTA